VEIVKIGRAAEDADANAERVFATLVRGAMVHSSYSPLRYSSTRSGRPSGNTTTEEILIRCPDWKIQQQRYGDNRPIVRVTRQNTLARHFFVLFVQTAVHRFYQVTYLIQNR
jgi:hypothetical protein